MIKKNIKTTRSGREHGEEAEHDVSEADVADELGQTRSNRALRGTDRPDETKKEK